MAVENYFLSREGRILSSKILKFMRSLIIKIDREANEEETKETYLKWLNYKYYKNYLILYYLKDFHHI